MNNESRAIWSVAKLAAVTVPAWALLLACHGRDKHDATENGLVSDRPFAAHVHRGLLCG